MASIGIRETTDSSAPLNILRCAATGAATLAIIFAVCWVTAVVGIVPASHMYISLFTNAPTGSGQALSVGIYWSLAFGALAGALIAVFYRAFGFLAQR
jgi:hypothetical protein